MTMNVFKDLLIDLDLTNLANYSYWHEDLSRLPMKAANGFMLSYCVLLSGIRLNALFLNSRCGPSTNSFRREPRFSAGGAGVVVVVVVGLGWAAACCKTPVLPDGLLGGGIR